MSWQEIRVGDLGEIITGKTPPTSNVDNYGGNTPFITPSDMVGNRSIVSTERYISEKGKNTIKNCILPPHAVCVSCIGSDMGKVVLTTAWSATNQQINSIVCNSHYDYRFVYYLMLTLRETIKSLGKNATAVPILNKTKFSNIQVAVPSLPIQKRIADFLSYYDDLIENNQKQIKLLEEAAQRLYKEWFVDLRFPGHETTPIVDGVPEGWSVVKLSDVAAVNKSSISKRYPYDYVDYVDLGSVSKGRIEAITRFSIQEAPDRAKRVASDGDIIWGMVRPNLKSYALVFHPAETSVFSTGFAVLSAQKIPFSFLYCLVTQDDFVGYLVNCTNGAAYPAVKPIHFEEATIMVPTDELLMQFNLIAEPMYRKIEVLEKQIQQAKEARDRLLPKLMSGEIEV